MHKMATPTYSYNGKMWKPCPTTSDKNSFFHSAFGKRANEGEPFFDKQAKFKRRCWGTFLTYFEGTTMPSPLIDALKKSWSSIDKYRNASIEDSDSFEDYVSDVMGAEHDIVMEEVPILAALENIEIIVIVDESYPIVIRPDVKILGDHPNSSKNKEAVVLCLEGNTFSRLEPLPSDDLNQIINESDAEIPNEVSNCLIKYEKGGSAGSKGVEYQVSILTVFLLNAFQKLKNWKLSTENKAAGKFDDVVLEWLEGAVLLQAKHKQNKSKKITLEDLISTNTKNDDFSLPKYFLAYEEIKNKFKIKNVIICTNASVDEKISKYVKRYNVSSDSILYYGNENCTFYTFNDNLQSCLIDKVRNYYEKNYQKKGVNEIVISQENLKQFLDHLQLYSSYPPEDNMMKVAEDILSRMKQLRLLQGEMSPSELYAKMMDWFQQKKGVYLTETYAKAIFSEIRRDKHWQRLEEYNILFQYNDLNFQDSKRLYHLVVKDKHLLQELKVFRTLQNTRTNILYANPEDGVEEQKQAIEAFKLPLHTILVLSWSKNFREYQLKEVSDQLSYILKENQHKKVILVAESNNTLPRSIGLSYGVVNSTVTFRDFLNHTQDELFKRNVIFQGKAVTLKDLIGTQTIEDYESALNVDVLEQLIRREEIKVGTQVLCLDENIKPFYIDRHFSRIIVMEDSFRSNEIEECFSEEFIYEVNEKMTIISDIAGTGKSTVLTKLAALVKSNHQNLWIIKINLIDYTLTLRDYVRKNKDTITITELLDSKRETHLRSSLERYVFSMRGKVVLMLDGIDEICPDYTTLVVKLLVQCQQEQNFVKIFVTTRPHVTPILETNLKVKSFVLQPFTEQNQIDFLTRYWAYFLNLNEEEVRKCKQYAGTLITKMTCWIASPTYSNNHFTAIPQQVRMLAEIFQEENQFNKSVEWEGCKEYLATDRAEPKLPDSMSFTRLYEMFIEKKREVFIDKGNPSGNTAANQALIDQFDDCLAHYRNLALEIIVGETKCHLFSHYQPASTKTETTMFKIGIVQMSEDEVHFVHRTFAEYFVAQSLVGALRDCSENVDFQSYLIDKVLINDDYNVTRVFFNSFLEPVVDDLPSNIFHQYQSVDYAIHSSQSNKIAIIHHLAEEGCVAILRLLLKCIDFQVIKDKVTEINQVYNSCEQEITGCIFSNILAFLQSLVQEGGINIYNESEKTPLICAIENNRLEMVKFLVSLGADININHHKHSTPLHIAVVSGFFEISEFLVQQGADVAARNIDNFSIPYVAVISGYPHIAALLLIKILSEGLDVDEGIVLYTAAYLGWLNVLEDLVEKGADLNCTVEEGENLFLAAARGGQLEIIQYLVFQGVDINKADSDRNTALHLISDSPSHYETAKLLMELGAKPDLENSNGLTPLHIAADSGVYDLVKAFVQAGTPVDIKNFEKETPLYCAACRGHLDTVKVLLHLGANVNAIASDHTILRGAVVNGQVDVAKYLVELGMDIMERDHSGKTLLHASAKKGELELVRFFLGLGIDVNVKNKDGITALELAAVWYHIHIVEYLVENGADVNARNRKGLTLQHFFAAKDNWRIIGFLANHGAKLDISDEEGRTPLHVAVSKGNCDTVRFLLEQGVDVTVRNYRGCTPLESAPLKHREEMIRVFKEYVEINNNVFDERLADQIINEDLEEIRILNREMGVV